MMSAKKLSDLKNLIIAMREHLPERFDLWVSEDISKEKWEQLSHEGAVATIPEYEQMVSIVEHSCNNNWPFPSQSAIVCINICGSWSAFIKHKDDATGLLQFMMYPNQFIKPEAPYRGLFVFRTKHDETDIVMIKWAIAKMQILALALCPMLFPCGYLTRSRIVGGFGSGEVRRKTAQMPIYRVLSRDRIYRECEEPGSTAAPRQLLNGRIGHWRYLWKRAGMERPSSRLSAFERLTLAIRNSVRQVWVNPIEGECRWSRANIESELVKNDEEFKMVMLERLKPVGGLANGVAQ